MARTGPRLIAAIVAVAAAALLVQQHRLDRARADRDRAQLEAGLAASRVLSAAFARAGTLRVARLSGEAMSQGSCVSGYLFTDRQRSVAPYAVDYVVDLAGVDHRAFGWNAAARRLTVDVPGVTVEPPAIDMARARSEQTGFVVSRGCGLAMQRQVAGRLAAAAGARAADPAYLDRARASARADLARLVGASLAAAGLGAVDVRVRLATDPRPASGPRWDVSRSIDDVVGNR